MVKCDEHNISRKSRCRFCPSASGVCRAHNRRKRRCRECNPSGHLAHVTANRIRSALKSKKNKRTIEYLGCSINEFREHIEKQFTGAMTWANHGEVWHIDHIIGLRFQNPSNDELIERLHFSNCQPMLASENMSKGARYCGKYDPDFK